MANHRAGALKRKREQAKRERQQKKEERRANRKTEDETGDGQPSFDESAEQAAPSPDDAT
jgi:hypothetical protein